MTENMMTKIWWWWWWQRRNTNMQLRHLFLNT